MLAARQNIIHDRIADAKYNDQDEFAPDEVAIAEATQIVESLKTCEKITPENLGRMTERRIDWLKMFRDPA